MAYTNSRGYVNISDLKILEYIFVNSKEQKEIFNSEFKALYDKYFNKGEIKEDLNYYL